MRMMNRRRKKRCNKEREIEKLRMNERNCGRKREEFVVVVFNMRMMNRRMKEVKEIKEMGIN